MKHYYTDEINTLVLLSLLKEHNIKKIIVSPGATNVSFVGSVQIDSYFEIFSAVDERAAAYMACGLAEECGEPVVLTCTGATASRNYIPGLTEAFYRGLPILAVTSTQDIGKVGNYVAQVIDRGEQFPDMVKKSYHLPIVHSKEEEQYVVTSVNDALLELTHGSRGPVHINLTTNYSYNFKTKELPAYRVIRRVPDQPFPNMPIGDVGIYVGAHEVFTKEETEAIDKFCECNNAVVICDQVSNYRGKYRFLASLCNSQPVDLGTKIFDLIIYIGYIHGAYIDFRGRQSWRVNGDGVVRDPFRTLTYVFEMDEKTFFEHYITNKKNNTLLEKCNEAITTVMEKVPELPFSNMWIAKETVSFIPKNSVLHMSILNTVRVWNYFDTPNGVECYANTGGYGIDGCLSSFLGSALANKEIQHYMIIGDLSFFYDINAVFNCIPSNIHIMLINNGIGTEFKNYNHRAACLGEDANQYIAAKGHNGNKNSDLVKKLCLNLNMNYLSACNKDEYLCNRDNWIEKSNAPVLFEIFTSDYDESEALRLMNNIMCDRSVKSYLKRSVLGKVLRRIKVKQK